jgi:hypothetical protein
MRAYDEREKTLILKYVISVYSARNETIFEIARNVNHELGAFKRLGNQEVRNLFKKLFRLTNARPSDKTFTDLLTTKPILYLSSDQKCFAFLDFPHKEKSMKYKDQDVLIKGLPAILYYVKEKQLLSVYEYISNDILVPLNLPNISNDGEMCLGGKSVDKDLSLNETMNAFYEMFWGGSFTSHNDNTSNNWTSGKYTYKSRIKPKSVRLEDII